MQTLLRLVPACVASLSTTLGNCTPPAPRRDEVMRCFRRNIAISVASYLARCPPPRWISKDEDGFWSSVDSKIVGDGVPAV
ncbi:hypothetical protein FB45DRAFT_931458 [Roridomyces roridus]|uniref:Secreted protein n=1 Tax=Roridomyces roridus TaxID=1738132 RepID=A0AAD7FH31_9AGAR|nr:hypothetical protein FB45DRAFT_931458 [Roridomyces roridus]